MKKRLGAAVLAILMLGITGCGSAKQDTMGVLIPDQTFEVTLNDWGKVTFASYAPENGVYMADGQNPDVRFGLVQDDQTIYEFPGANEAYTSTDLFLAVSAISFKDYNDDGLQDVITICEYETMAGEGYQIARVYYQLEEKQGFVEDALLTQYLSEQRKTENIAAVLEMKEAYREYADSLNGQQELHAQLSVMAREKEVWAVQAEFANEICQYAVTDLDHNGRYEIIVANMGGTGMYTYSRFWEINEQCSGLTECETDFLEGDSQPDLMTEEWETYTDDAGRKYYVVYDLTRNGAAEYYENVRVISLQNGKIAAVPIAYRTTIYEEGKAEITCEDASGNVISEADYEGAAERYLNGYQRGTTVLGWQDLREIPQDEAELKELLEASVGDFVKGRK